MWGGEKYDKMGSYLLDYPHPHGISHLLLKISDTTGEGASPEQGIKNNKPEITMSCYTIFCNKGSSYMNWVSCNNCSHEVDWSCYVLLQHAVNTTYAVLYIYLPLQIFKCVLTQYDHYDMNHRIILRPISNREYVALHLALTQDIKMTVLQ